MILTMTKHHENLPRDSPLSLLSMVEFCSSLETKMILKIPNETFLRITQYQQMDRYALEASASQVVISTPVCLDICKKRGRMMRKFYVQDPMGVVLTVAKKKWNYLSLYFHAVFL